MQTFVNELSFKSAVVVCECFPGSGEKSQKHSKMARSQAQLLEELCQKFQKEAEELGAAVSIDAIRDLITVPQRT